MPPQFFGLDRLPDPLTVHPFQPEIQGNTVLVRAGSSGIVALGADLVVIFRAAVGGFDVDRFSGRQSIGEIAEHKQQAQGDMFTFFFRGKPNTQSALLRASWLIVPSLLSSLTLAWRLLRRLLSCIDPLPMTKKRSDDCSAGAYSGKNNEEAISKIDKMRRCMKGGIDVFWFVTLLPICWLGAD
jgi:hypothetical protein